MPIIVSEESSVLFTRSASAYRVCMVYILTVYVHTVNLLSVETMIRLILGEQLQRSCEGQGVPQREILPFCPRDLRFDPQFHNQQKMNFSKWLKAFLFSPFEVPVLPVCSKVICRDIRITLLGLQATFSISPGNSRQVCVVSSNTHDLGVKPWASRKQSLKAVASDSRH